MSLADYKEELKRAVAFVDESEYEDDHAAESAEFEDTHHLRRSNFSIKIKRIRRFIDKIRNIPHDNSGLMVVLGQLFSFRCQYHRLLDSHANEKLLLGLEEVAQEFESLFGRIASRLNKLNTKAQTKLLDLVAQSAFQPVMNCLGDFGDEINLILEIIVDYRYCLEFFESGTLRTQHNVQLAEQDGDNDHQREIELEEELNRANYYQAGLQTSIDSLQADLNRFRGDNNDLKQKIQDLQNQNRNLQALVEEIQTNFKQTNRQNEELSGKRQQKIEELEQKLSSTNASKESLEQSLREVNEKQLKTTAQLHASRQESANLSKQLETKTK